MADGQRNDVTSYYLELFSFLVAGMIVVLENVILVGLVYKSESLHTAKYLFTCSLAITDLSVGILSIITSSVHLVFGSVAVTLVTSALLLQAGFVMLSITHMAIIAIERYVYIAHPYLYEMHVTTSKIAKFLAVFWIAGLSYTIFVCFIQLYVVGKDVFVMSAVNKALKYSSFLSVYIFMTIVSFVLYVLILIQVKKHSNSVTCSTQPKALLKWRENVRCIKFFVTVFGLYFLMTSPYFIGEIAIGVQASSFAIKYVLLISIVLNSGVNFIILCVVDRHFRQILKTSLSKLIHLVTMRHATRR